MYANLFTDKYIYAVGFNCNTASMTLQTMDQTVLDSEERDKDRDRDRELESETERETERQRQRFR